MPLFADYEEKPNYSSGTFPTLRPFQSIAHDALRQGDRDGHRCQVVMAPTGAGKTILAMNIIQQALLKGKRCLFVCDRTSLINQTSDVADCLGLSAHGIIQSNHWRTNLRHPFQIASVQTLMRRGWPETDVIVCDECFVAGTLVDGKPIETIKVGDYVSSFNEQTKEIEQKRVMNVFKKFASKTVCVSIDNTINIVCTPNHPFYNGETYVTADCLTKGSTAYRIANTGLFTRVQTTIKKILSPVFDLWRLVCTFTDSHSDSTEEPIVNDMSVGRLHIEEERNFKNRQQRKDEEIFGFRPKGGNEDKQSHETRIRTRKDEGKLIEDRAQANSARREWKGNDRSATNFIGKVGRWILSRIYSSYKKRAGKSEPLQNRYSESRINDCNRSGWWEPRINQEKRTGRSKRFVITPVRVESVTVQKFYNYRGCGIGNSYRQGVDVYNIEVEGNNNYFAEGILVHNCHTLYKSAIDHFQKTTARVIGLSATPFSVGLGNTYTNLVNSTTMDELTKQGILVPMRIFSCTKIDMKGAETKGGEWTERAAGERSREITGDVVMEWAKYAINRKTIGFFPDIATTESYTAAFKAAGYRAEAFTSHTDDNERAELLAEYRKKDSQIRLLLSVEALAKGFDVPDIEAGIDARPFRKSLSSVIQMWGRILRSHPGKDDAFLLDFAGNIHRFADDFSDIFFNGLDALDMGEKLDKTIRKDDGEKEPAKCPKCGFSPCGKKCIQCGYVKPARQSTVEVAAGTMGEIMLNGAKLADNTRHLYEQICTHTRSTGNPLTAKQRAFYLYKDMAGKQPPNTWKFEEVPNTPITQNVANKIKSLRIAWVKRNG